MDSPFLILKLMDGPIFENLADFGLTSAILYGTPCKLLENGPFPDFFLAFSRFFTYGWPFSNFEAYGWLYFQKI